MSYKSFEELPVWQQAADLYEKTDDFLEHAPPRMRSAFNALTAPRRPQNFKFQISNLEIWNLEIWHMTARLGIQMLEAKSEPI